MKELVYEALKSGACDRSQIDGWRQPGDACIEALAIGSSRTEDYE